ncbi:MAG: UDP-glucose dehydrogenase family protein [Marmoricola sp.]
MRRQTLGTSAFVRISVIGTGYLGATHAACLAAWGHTVVGVDTDPARADRLASGSAPFHEPGLDALLAEGVAAGRLSFGTDPAAAADCDAHFLCVGTPQRGTGGEADLRPLWGATEALLPHLRPESLLIGKSTVPVGTARRLLDWCVDRAARPVSLAWNPEFLREGHAVADTLHPDRLVFGVGEAGDERVLRRIYAAALTSGVPAVTTGLETAELAKVAANLMLAARIDLVNLLAETCEASGADVRDLTRVLGLDPRIGSAVLVPGIGYGGGCLPKDSRAFGARAEELGVPGARAFVDHLDAINERARDRAVQAARALLGGAVEGAAVAVLGAAFKAESDDVRDSPALDVACRMHRLGADVRVYDPRAAANVRRAAPELAVCPSAADACAAAEVVMVLTEWDEFAGLDPHELAHLVRVPAVVDGRQVLDTAAWVDAGWDVHTLGTGRRGPDRSTGGRATPERRSA